MKCRILLATVLLGPLAALHAADRKPNFLFIYSDDHRRDAMCVVQREHGERARFPWFKSPGMDRLAAGGVRFRNAAARATKKRAPVLHRCPFVN